MSRTYSSWAINQSDIPMIRLATVVGNEQDQLKNLERVEGAPHMYVNLDIPPPPQQSTTRVDMRAMQPIMISRQNSAFFPTSTVVRTPSNVQTKLWPVEKSSKNMSVCESASSTSKRNHKHKHNHHHHHHHHRHHHHNNSRRHRAKSVESIRNRPHQRLLSPSKVMLAAPQYIEQDQQQQQQQPMIVYREVPSGEGYTVDTNGLASVPYAVENETGLVDDQQAPLIVYRDANFQQQQQQQQSYLTDEVTQPLFINQDQEAIIGNQNVPLHTIKKSLTSSRVTPLNETQVGNYSPMICNRSPVLINTKPCVNTGFIQEIERIYVEEDCCIPSTTHKCVSDSYILQQCEPHFCLSHQNPSQLVYCTEPSHQDYLCTSPTNNIIQQSVTPQPQFVCVDNTPGTLQPTIINQIPVFNPLSSSTPTQSVVSLPQTQLQRTASVMVQQPQQLQVVQQPQPVQIIQQPQPLQVIQQPQPLQIIQNPQQQPAQLLQIAPAAPQFIQSVQPQVIQGGSVLQTIQTSPQILYQRPYDPAVLPVQNQQLAVASQPLVALSQPSYAPSRIIPAATTVQVQGPAMFRNALLRTVSDRTGVPVASVPPNITGVPLMQPTMAAPAASPPSALISGGLQQSASVPLVPLTAGGLLIPFRPSQTPGMRPGLSTRFGGYPSVLRNFNDIRQQIEERREFLDKTLRQQAYNRAPSPPIISPGQTYQKSLYTSGTPANRTPFPVLTPGQTYQRNPYTSGTSTGRTPLPVLTPGSYSRAPLSGLTYSQPSFAGSNLGSVASGPTTPYRTILS